MKRVLPVLFFLTLMSSFIFAADDVTGIWKIIDDKTKKPTAYTSLYMYQGQMYGRIIATINKTSGQVDDTMSTKKFTATKLAGNPPNCGLDFVYKMQTRGKEWFGLIIDPESGDEYDCVIKKNGSQLIVRGQLKGLGFLGRDQVWHSASVAELPTDFTLPNPSTFVPTIPKKK